MLKALHTDGEELHPTRETEGSPAGTAILKLEGLLASGQISRFYGSLGSILRTMRRTIERNSKPSN
jgi:hypothetical protein